MSQFFSTAPLWSPRWKRIGGEPVMTCVIPEIAARSRVIIHAPDDLNRGKQERERDEDNTDISLYIYLYGGSLVGWDKRQMVTDVSYAHTRTRVYIYSVCMCVFCVCVCIHTPPYRRSSSIVVTASWHSSPAENNKSRPRERESKSTLSNHRSGFSLLSAPFFCCGRRGSIQMMNNEDEPLAHLSSGPNDIKRDEKSQRVTCRVCERERENLLYAPLIMRLISAADSWKKGVGVSSGAKSNTAAAVSWPLANE